MITEVIDVTKTLIDKLFTVSEKRERIRLVKAIKRNRRQIYRDFTKDGVITDNEQKLLNELDNAWVEATIKLGNF